VKRGEWPTWCGASPSPRAFLNILTFTAASAGTRGGAVDPAVRSPRRAGGGSLVQQRVALRWRACPACGASLHRAHTAARASHWWRRRGLAGASAGASARMSQEPVGL
jgi:hypothetical protein